MKERINFIVLAFLLLSFSLVSATLEIEKKVVSDAVIIELKNSAEFEFILKNTGESDSFTIYSLVGVDVEPKESFTLASGEVKKINVKFYPSKDFLKEENVLNFVYKIKGEKSGVQEDVLAVNIVNLKNALEAGSYNINPDSLIARVYLRNRANYDFPEIKTRFTSLFFDFDKTFSLGAFETKEFEVPLEKERIKQLTAGSYIITGEIEVSGIKEKIENTFRFLEKSGIVTEEKKSGLIISRKTIEKRNDGNLPELAVVEVKKNALSRLFTTFNIEPVKSERKGFSLEYTFQKEIKPAETFAVKVTTNWLYPLILLFVVMLTAYLVSVYTATYLVVRKSSTFVRTKGGEFALKISLKVRARKFVERINVIDRFPAITKIHERFVVAPDKIDEKNRRLEWNIPFLQAGEERIFSYIIYSKVGVVGRFEIPSATAVYEKEGKSHETQSNRVYFLSDVRKKEENY